MEYIRKLDNNDFNNFKKVFVVFEAEPFYEEWTEDDYLQEFLDFLASGEMYGIFLGEEICGLITIKERYLKWDQLAEIDVERSIYLSDIAVCRAARNNGYATKLMQYIIARYGQDFDIYMRTNLENSMSEGIAVKNGFEIIPDKIETVAFKRTRPDIPEIDERKYLIRRKNEKIDQSCPKKLNQYQNSSI